MAAIIILNEWNGSVGAPTKTDKSNGAIVLRANDSYVTDSQNPIPIPKSGISRSFEKWLRFRIGSVGPTGSITNLKFFTTGVNLLGTGLTLYAGATESYVQPTQNDSAVANVDATTLLSGSPLNLGAGPYSTSNTDIGSFCVLQADVSPVAVDGLSGTLIPTFSYDES